MMMMMTQSAKLINGGLALILISTSGCAGNGLRNMFSRNETAGYKTLEELEEERLAAEKNSDEESGPRFASWLPFGRKNAEETESIAAADDAVAESEGPKKSGWWRNPFRRQEAIEADPFLENELPTEVVVAGKKDAKDKAEVVASDTKTKATKDVAAVKDRAVRTVSATSDSEASEDDDLMVEKFEKHFQQTTESTAKAAGKGSDLIVAGVEGAAASAVASKKKTEASADSVNRAADKKLAEFEELLAAKKTAAAKARKDVQFEEEFEAAEGAADDFAESVAEASKSTEKHVLKTGKQAAAVDEFDSLFEPVEKPVAAKKKKTGAAKASTNATDDVNVARADDIFGKESVSGTGSGRQAKKPSIAGGWKGEESNSASAREAGNAGKGQQSDLARKVIDTTVDQFAAMFSARTQDGAPRATAPDADGWTAASEGKAVAGGRRGLPVRTASNGRKLGTALDTPAGLKDDRFFASGNNPPLVTNLQAVPESEMNGSGASVPAAPIIIEHSNDKAARQGIHVSSVFSFRNIVLVIGGIIVAALLFAPGRKKPTEANQLPVQG
jgi:hypothetical protein